MAVVASLLVAMPGVVTPTAARAEPDDPRVEIVGGVRAAEGEFPWVVRLSNGCAGTLIGEQYVLTAAHCVQRTGPTRAITTTAGSADLHSVKTIKVSSSEVRRAEDFRKVTEGDDWAVVKLARAVDLPVVDLPAGPSLDEGSFTVIGWGAVNESSPAHERHLRKVEVPFVSDSECATLYRKHGYSFVSSDMLCAGDVDKGGKDSCQGDSGGPLLRRHDKRWVQVGIVSWGVGCGRKDAPGVYTQVSHFASEIRDALE